MDRRIMAGLVNRSQLGRWLGDPILRTIFRTLTLAEERLLTRGAQRERAVIGPEIWGLPASLLVPSKRMREFTAHFRGDILLHSHPTTSISLHASQFHG